MRGAALECRGAAWGTSTGAFARWAAGAVSLAGALLRASVPVVGQRYPAVASQQAAWNPCMARCTFALMDCVALWCSGAACSSGLTATPDQLLAQACHPHLLTHKPIAALHRLQALASLPPAPHMQHQQQQEHQPLQLHQLRRHRQQFHQLLQHQRAGQQQCLDHHQQQQQLEQQQDTNRPWPQQLWAAAAS